MGTEVDSDYVWLKSHLTYVGKIPSRIDLAEGVGSLIQEKVETGLLPYTLGVFGGWGTGKTTFLALLAKQLECEGFKSIVYFNSWKYAGFMEIVPALIYKILQFGRAKTQRGKDKAAVKVLLALGEKYSGQVGEWAKKKIGINPTELFKDVYGLVKKAETGVAAISPDVIAAYYTQVDKAQDALVDALGAVSAGEAANDPVVVLIDELDRCDPDEAFTVIKQMRVLFGMRNLPVLFVICANPEPIGLAIKHRYGLETGTSDYEARRILEKFVDGYFDLEAETSLQDVVEPMWDGKKLPWLVRMDEAMRKAAMESGDSDSDAESDMVKYARAYDVISTSTPLFANLRVLRKSFEYVGATAEDGKFFWTRWLLEIANQLDPEFRRDLRGLSSVLQKITYDAHRSLRGHLMTVKYDVEKSSFVSEKGNTLYAIFHAAFWEHARSAMLELKKSEQVDDVRRAEALRLLLQDSRRLDFVLVLSLLPLENLPDFDEFVKLFSHESLHDFETALTGECEVFGWELHS